MNHPAILCPALGLVGLTFVVATWMFYTRVRYMQQTRFNLKLAKSRSTMAVATQSVSGPADNLQNLFELPVLFYALVPLLIVTSTSSLGFVIAGWAYVGLRALHSLIHCTYNNVMHRFTAYLLSSLVLLGMWVGFALSLH